MAWSSERRLPLLLTALAALACAQPQPLFLNRSVNPKATAQDVPPPVRAQYDAIDSKASLLLQFCVKDDGEMCPGDAFRQEYSLESLFRVGANRARMDLQTVRNQWFQEATTAQDGHQPPFNTSKLTADTILQSFDLLAVVNRLDLGVWQNGRQKWIAPELRFIFGAKHAPGAQPRFTLIVEFILPDMNWKTFQDQAGRWKSLSPSTAPGFSENALTKVIEQTGYRNAASIRIRANCQADGNSWRFSQWEFHPGSFGQTPLDYQLTNADAQQSGPASGMYLDFWNRALTDARIQLTVPGGLSAKTADYFFSPRDPFLAPPANLSDSPQLRNARNLIALQRCTGCHSRETDTHLQHVTEAGGVSAFLLPHRIWNPTLEALTAASDGPDSATSPVLVHYCVAGNADALAAGGCPAGQTLVSETRRYHDLARRKLFMATLLAAPRHAPGESAIRQIMNYAPDFAH